MAYGLIPELISASIFRRLRSPGCSSGPYPIEGPPAAGENLKITPGNNSHTGTSVTLCPLVQHLSVAPADRVCLLLWSHNWDLCSHLCLLVTAGLQHVTA